MKHLTTFYLSFLILPISLLAEESDLCLHLPAKDGTANGKKVVLMAGDEEYRSEESCPMLAKILSQHHGFDCTVLFSINPDGNYIDPNYHGNTPGMEHLDEADLLIIGTRFRELPEDQYQHLADYLNAGKPVIGFRTATHAFTGKAVSGNLKWSEFGLKILGERWVSHHGKHKAEGCRGVIEKSNQGQAVLRGVADVFGPSDVYGVKNLDESQATVLLRGAITETMEADSKILAEDPRNQPMMAMAWLRQYTAPNGSATGQAFCTTMGASVDFLNSDLRRLIVNAAYYLTGLEVPDRAQVDFVDPFKPTFFGFNRAAGFYKDKALKPSMYQLGTNVATGLSVNPPKKPRKKRVKE